VKSWQLTGRLRSREQGLRKIDTGLLKPQGMPTPEEILETPSTPRVLKVHANVIAYFGDYFQAFSAGMKLTVGPVKSSRKGQSNTASSHNRS
jgi:hypothetical protein